MSSKYSLVQKTATIVIENEDGEETEYTIRELTASKRDKYLDKLSKRIRIGPNGETQGVSNFDGLQSDLLMSCLFLGEQPVSAETIQKWPASVVSGIFKEAQELNKLDKEIEEATPKNE